MAEHNREKILQEHPIKNGLDAFRTSFDEICKDKGIASCSDALGRDDLRDVACDLFLALLGLKASRLLRSSGRAKNLFGDISRIISAIDSDNYDIKRVEPLLSAVLNKESDDVIWDEVYDAVIEYTPPPTPVSPFQPTPVKYTTSSFVNSSEFRKNLDPVLREELDLMYAGVDGFYKAYFGDITDLSALTEAVFGECKQGDNPLYSEKNGWTEWPKDAQEDGVLSWLSELINKFTQFAEEHGFHPNAPRRPLAQPNTPLEGSGPKRKLDVGLVDDPRAGKASKCHWSQILVPGELKSNPATDTSSQTWLDLARYAREVFAAQDTRSFILGFTLCGSLMRLWMFDRLGAISSEPFDINQNGRQFVSTVLGFLWMNKAELGFDPTIITTTEGRRYIEIERNGQPERLIIDKTLKRAPCVAGRATTCWKAYREGDDSRAPLVIKDSWQYPEREREGKLLCEATNKNVVNVATYYHHEDVRVSGEIDDIRRNVRKGLDVTKRQGRSIPQPNASAVGAPQNGRSNSSTAGQKRPSSYTDAFIPSSKRPCLRSPNDSSMMGLNRVHRRVIVSDYGKALYKASSPAALLAALAGCIEGYESLRKNAGLLQGDISIGNLIMNEDSRNPSHHAFLIDLDLALRVQRDESSGAREKTGTRPFMAIGLLSGENRSYMHDLESFFWVLFWICAHYDGPGRDIGPTQFESWNYEEDRKLGMIKLGLVADESLFLKTAKESFTPYYRRLIPCVNRLRRRVFPDGSPWKKSDQGLHSDMMDILWEARRELEKSILL